MAALAHGVRQLRSGIGVFKPPGGRSTLFAETRTLLSRFVSHISTSLSSSPLPPSSSLVRPTQFSNSQTIRSRFSLPVKHALSRPFSAPRLPKPPVVPANVTQVGLGTARAFHSGRPIFQNMVDNVPIATRALWEAEWDVKMKKKEARRMLRAAQNKAVPKSREMLKPKPKPLQSTPELPRDASELDFYFPVEPTPSVTTHLLVPLAPTPTARLPLSAHADSGNLHPLLPISDLASIHTSHRLHSLRVSTLFARLDAANVWDDPGVNVDAYAFGSRRDAQEKQCTVLRVTFRGWNVDRVRAILGGNAEEWYSLEETHPDGRPTSVPLLDVGQDMNPVHTHPESASLESVEVDSGCASEVEMVDEHDTIPPLPVRASASAQHDLVLPTLDFSSSFADSLASPPQPVIFLRTVSELTRRQAELIPSSPSSASPVLLPLETSWEYLGSNTSSSQWL